MSELFHRKAFKQVIEGQLPSAKSANFMSPSTGHLTNPSHLANLQESSVVRKGISLISEGEEGSGIYSALKTLNPRVIEDPPAEALQVKSGNTFQSDAYGHFVQSFEADDKENSRPNDELEVKITDLRGRINEIKSSITQELNQSVQGLNEQKPLQPDMFGDIESPTHFKMKIDQIKQNLLLESNISEAPRQQSEQNNESKLMPVQEDSQNEENKIPETMSPDTVMSFPPLPNSHSHDIDLLERENQSLKRKLLDIERSEQMLEQKYQNIERERLVDREHYSRTIQRLQEEMKTLSRSIERNSNTCLIREVPTHDSYERLPRSAKNSDYKGQKTVRTSMPRLHQISRSHSSSPMPRKTLPPKCMTTKQPKRQSGIAYKPAMTTQRQMKSNFRFERKKSGMICGKGKKGKLKKFSKDFSSEPVNCTTPSVSAFTQREEEMKELQSQRQKDTRQIEGLRMKLALLKSVNQRITRTFKDNIEEVRGSLKEFEMEVIKRQDDIRQEYEAQVAELVGRFKKVSEEIDDQERRMDRQRVRKVELENQRLREKMKQIEVIFNSQK